MNLKSGLNCLLLFSVLQVQAQIDTSFAYRKPLFDFNYGKPVFALDSLSNRNLSLRYVALTGYREGVVRNTGQMVNADKRLQTNQFYWNNLSVKDLLMISLLVSPSRFLFEVNDPSAFVYRPEYGNEQVWLRKYGHCFEYMLPSGLNLNNEQRQQLVEGMLGLEGKWEQRKVRCLAMVRTSRRNKLTANGKSVPDVIGYLEQMFGIGEVYGSPLPIVNQTGFAEGQGLEGSFVWSDLERVRKQLQRYDLDLVEKELETRMYVIKEINE